MLAMMTIAAPAPPPPSPSAITPRPALLHDHASAIQAWHAILSGLAPIEHHRTKPFFATDFEGWTYELILFGARVTHEGKNEHVYVIRVCDEHDEVVGYL